jgi:pilus assembly protein CpaF
MTDPGAGSATNVGPDHRRSGDTTPAAAPAAAGAADPAANTPAAPAAGGAMTGSGGRQLAGASATGILSPQLRDAVARRLKDDAELTTGRIDRAGLRRAVARALAAEGVVTAPEVWARLVRDLVDDLGGLGPLEPLLRDPAVTDVMVNGAEEVHVERAGQVTRVPVAFEDDEHLVRVLARILGPLGARLDRAHPFVDAVLPGGVRLHAILPPLAERPTVTLRRVPAVVPSWEELAAAGSVNEEVRALLVAAVRSRRNLVVSGRAGVGKTTLLARLLAEVGDDRVVVIEDAPELRRPASHTVHLRTRPASPDGVGGVDVATLVRNALRMRPDRLVVGEVRGPEVTDLLQAMNTGHDGSMTTIHANGPREAIVRLEGMALLAGIPLPAARAQVAAAIDLVVALDRDDGARRRVAGLLAVTPGPEGAEVEEVWSCS